MGACETFGVHKQLISPPLNASDQPRWLAKLRELRDQCRTRLHLNDSLFSDTALSWTQTAFVQTQAHPFDTTFFNGTHYTVELWAESLKATYGGVDGVLLWPTFPLLGYDDRSQFEMVEILPGGVPELRRVAARLHGLGIRLLWPFNPWDQRTRRTHQSDAGTYTRGFDWVLALYFECVFSISRISNTYE